MGCWWVLLCELDGRVLGGMQFGVAALRALRPGARGHAVWGAGGCFASLTAGCYAVGGAGGCCFAGATGHAVWGAGRCCFASLTAGWGAAGLRAGRRA